MKLHPRPAAWSAGASLLVAILGLQACGNGSSSGCGPKVDHVTARNTLVTVSSSALQPPNCEVLASPGIQIVTDSGGKADTQFGDGTQNIGECWFHQLDGAPKPAIFATREPAAALFTVTNGEADCTVNSVFQAPLCGLATLYPDATITGVILGCNNDPVVYVAVYRGGATLSAGAEPAAKGEHVGANDQVTLDLATGKFTHSVPQFTAEQISHFDVQLDALVAGVSLTDQYSLLHVRTLSASNVVVAPNGLQQKLAQNYGSAGAMCGQASSVPVVFYPRDPKASTPQVYGSVCSNKQATVYGVAIYRQGGVGFSGAYFQESGSGTLIRTDIFPKPITLELGSSRSVFSWDGSLAGAGSAPSPTPGLAPRDVYILKFLYQLVPDTTPRLGYVAVSLFGAPFPTQTG